MQNAPKTVRKFEHGPLAYLLAARRPSTCANDNGEEPASQAMLDAALRYFAQHGLGAARAARHQAEQAFFAGERDTYRWWLGICRLLDKRMAMIAARELERTESTGTE